MGVMSSYVRMISAFIRRILLWFTTCSLGCLKQFGSASQSVVNQHPADLKHDHHEYQETANWVTLARKFFTLGE